MPVGVRRSQLAASNRAHRAQHHHREGPPRRKGCRILNRIHAAKPGFLLSLAGGVVDSLDQEEIGAVAQWMVSDLAQALKPLAPTLMPVFIKALTELLSPQGGYESTEQTEAIQGLRATLAHAAGGEK